MDFKVREIKREQERKEEDSDDSNVFFPGVDREEEEYQEKFVRRYMDLKKKIQIYKRLANLSSDQKNMLQFLQNTNISQT